jgi:hypothetical protein
VNPLKTLLSPAIRGKMLYDDPFNNLGENKVQRAKKNAHYRQYQQDDLCQMPGFFGSWPVHLAQFTDSLSEITLDGVWLFWFLSSISHIWLLYYHPTGLTPTEESILRLKRRL